MPKIHGEFFCKRLLNVIQIDLKGSFNLEGVKAAHDEIIIRHNLKQWKLLIVLKGDTLLVWEAIAEVKNFFYWCSLHNCQVIVYVVVNNLQIDITKGALRDIPLRCKFFYDLKSATKWLNINGSPH